MKEIFTYTLFILLFQSKELIDGIVRLKSVNYDDIGAFFVLSMFCYLFYRKMIKNEKEVKDAYFFVIESQKEYIKKLEEKIKKDGDKENKI